ncbi:MAG: hypothetical protein ACFFDW_09190 [Candidatus Thorarchaeota archaeon]
MLTAEKFHEILLELDAQNQLGCTYDFQERHSVGLKPFELLDVVKVISTRIPACGEHCIKYQDCKHISLFEKRKSIVKFQLTKFGSNLVEYFKTKEFTKEEIKDVIKKELKTASLYSKLELLFKDSVQISTVEIISYLLENSTIDLYTLRTSLKDILDLMDSLKIISNREGIFALNG